MSFISSVSKEHKRRQSPTQSFVVAKPILARFRIWAMSFDSEECPLEKILVEDDFLKETVVLFLSGFVALASSEFGFCKLHLSQNPIKIPNV